jgi:hypothetical protein
MLTSVSRLMQGREYDVIMQWLAIEMVSVLPDKAKANLGSHNICSMLSIMHSENTSNLQLVLGIFLLALGAQKHMIEVLTHAGFSLSYSVITKIKETLHDGTTQSVCIVHEKMCMIVSDNIKIAFQVTQQCVESTDHFDNGTTATLIPLFDAHMLGSVLLVLRNVRTASLRSPQVLWSGAGSRWKGLGFSLCATPS